MKLLELLKYFFVFSSVISFAVLTGCSDSRSRSVDELLFLAADSADKGKWKEAQEFASQALELDNKNVNAGVFYAIALDNNEKYDRAMEQINGVANSNEAHNNFPAKYTLGKMLYEKGHRGEGVQNFIDAQKPLKRALELEPDSWEAMLLLAKTYYRSSNYKEAIRVYEALYRSQSGSRFKNDPKFYNEVAMCYMKQSGDKPTEEDILKARRFFSEAYKLQANKNVPRIVFNLAVFADKYSNYSKQVALRFYREFLEMAKDNSEYLYETPGVRRRIDQLER